MEEERSRTHTTHSFDEPPRDAAPVEGMPYQAKGCRTSRRDAAPVEGMPHQSKRDSPDGGGQGEGLGQLARRRVRGGERTMACGLWLMGG